MTQEQKNDWIMERAALIQDNMHEIIEDTIEHARKKKPKRSLIDRITGRNRPTFPDYQSICDTFLMMKIAQLELQIWELQNAQQKTTA